MLTATTHLVQGRESPSQLVLWPESGLALVIMSGWTPSSMVKVMKEGSDSSAPPVWVMPVFSGVTACFDSMLNSYDAPYRRTVYGLTDPYITGNEEALTASFDDWIGLYVAAIKTKQEQGPYTFMGYSQGKCNTRAPHRRTAPTPAKRPRV